jgi:putative transposase
MARLVIELFELSARGEGAGWHRGGDVVAEMYVQGVSTRKVKAVTETLGGHGFSASSISAINKTLGENLRAFSERRDEAYP